MGPRNLLPDDLWPLVVGYLVGDGNGTAAGRARPPADEAGEAGQNYKRFKSIAELLGASGRRSGSEPHVLQDKAGAQSPNSE